MNKDLIAYYIENMASKEFIQALFLKYGIPYRKSYSYHKHTKAFLDSSINVDPKDFASMCRQTWHSSPIDYHKNNLTSGKLLGHNWHNSRPSQLHLSLQDKVRNCIATNGEIDDLWEIAIDIMKQEYFIVATHDICESLIINDFVDTLPPTRNKSISDFIFKSIPYDLKVSTYPDLWTKGPCRTTKDRTELAMSLLNNADTLRIRKQAKNTHKGWGNNRFYIIVSSQDKWFSNTEYVLKEIKNKIHKLGQPIKITIGQDSLLVQIVEI